MGGTFDVDYDDFGIGLDRLDAVNTCQLHAIGIFSYMKIHQCKVYILYINTRMTRVTETSAMQLGLEAASPSPLTSHPLTFRHP